MGQAKRRGTFEERKTQAIERDKRVRETMAKYDTEHPIKPSGMSINDKMMLAYFFAMAERTGRPR